MILHNITLQIFFVGGFLIGKYSFSWISKLINYFKEGNKYKNIDKKFEIKINDLVMCTKNINNDIVNGSCGVVIDFVEGYPLVRYNNNVKLVMEPQEIPHNVIKGLVFKYIPLKYSWAITIHKCQGMTLDLCIIDIGNDLEVNGQFISKLIENINDDDVLVGHILDKQDRYYELHNQC